MFLRKQCKVGAAPGLKCNEQYNYGLALRFFAIHGHISHKMGDH